MKVSVVIPTYNNWEGLRSLQKSLAGQTVKPHEVVVVDDASTFDAPYDIEHIFGSFNLLHLRNQSNLGAGSSRNIGASKITGEIILFADSDDTFPRNYIAKVSEIFSNEDVDVIFHDRRNKKHLGWYRSLGVGNRVSTTGTAIRADVFPGFNEDLSVCEDLELWLRLCAYRPVKFVHDPGLIIDRRSSGLTSLNRGLMRKVENHVRLDHFRKHPGTGNFIALSISLVKQLCAK